MHSAARTTLMGVLDNAKQYGFAALQTQVNGLFLPEDR